MTGVRLDFGKTDIGGNSVQGMNDLAVSPGRKQPVAGKRKDAKAGLGIPEGIGQDTVVITGQIEIVHRPRRIQVRVCVKAINKGNALMTQVTFDLEIRIEPVTDGVAFLQPPTKFPMQGGLGKVGYMGSHTGNRQSAMGTFVMGMIIPRTPIGIGHDRLPANLVESDVLG